MTQTKTVVEFAHDERGLLVAISDDGKRHEAVLVERRSVSPENRMALATFVASLAEVRDLKELAPGEAVTCYENCQIQIRGLPWTIRRGQRVDDREMIEALLASGRRLLHEDSPEALDISSESLLEAAVADTKHEGIMMATLVARRAAAAAGV